MVATLQQTSMNPASIRPALVPGDLSHLWVYRYLRIAGRSTMGGMVTGGFDRNVQSDSS